MAYLSESGPSPAPSPTTSGYNIAEVAAKYAAMSGGATGADAPVVPLWLARPATPVIAPARRAARTTKTYGRLEGNEGNTSLTPGEKWSNPNFFTDPSSHTQTLSKSGAEVYWFDMSDEERRAFAEKAIKAGLWEPKDGAKGLISAWAQAVDMAASYNSANPDAKDKWLSPWEALDKLYAAGVAAAGGDMDAFGDGSAQPYTGWRTSKFKSVKKFTDDEIQATATQILQQELGRDPTKAELKAFTIAANQNAAANPQTVTERSRDIAWDESGRPIDSETERTVDGEQYDPTADILGSVRGSEEQKNVKMATDYFSAAMQALGAIA